jgi:hypothetical protein
MSHPPRGLLRALWQPLWRVLRRTVRSVLLTLAALVLFFEEWGWRPLMAAMARLAQWPPLAHLEAAIRRTPPRWALVLFLVPAVLLLPVKLLALGLIHQGRTSLGITVIVAAKLVGTALVGRIFMLTEPQLMQFAWFARALGWWRSTKARVHAAVVASVTWRAAHAVRRRMRVLLKRLGRQLGR